MKIAYLPKVPQEARGTRRVEEGLFTAPFLLKPLCYFEHVEGGNRGLWQFVLLSCHRVVAKCGLDDAHSLGGFLLRSEVDCLCFFVC